MRTKTNTISRVAAIVVGAMGLSACGGGGSSSETEGTGDAIPFNVSYSCAASQLETRTNGTAGCQIFAEIDVNSNNKADGIDLNGDAIPELLFLTLEDSSAKDGSEIIGIDTNADNLPDFYLFKSSAGKLAINSKKDGSGKQVNIITDGSGSVIGLDTNGDGSSDDSLIADISNDNTAPQVSLDVKSGLYKDAQKVTLSCTDNVACNALAYTLDGSTPDFNGNGTMAVGNKVEITIGDTSGAYQLVYIARDAAGNISAQDDANYYVSADTCPVVPELTLAAHQEVNRGETVTLQTESFSYPYGSVDYEWSQVTVGDEPDVTNGSALTDAAPQFTAPDKVTSLKFNLLATSNIGCSAPAATTVVYVMKDKANALFVDGVNGDDTHPGTRAEPLKTLDWGDVRTPNPQKDIYVTANGGQAYGYSDQQNSYLAFGDIFGGFNEDWMRDTTSNKTIVQAAGNSTRLRVTNRNATDIEISGMDFRGVAGTVGTGQVGLIADLQSAEGNLLFTQNSVTAADGVNPTARSSHGFIVRGPGSIALNSNTLLAGRGADGQNGTNGRRGRAGGSGSTGFDGTCDAGGGSGGAGGYSSWGGSGGIGGSGSESNRGGNGATGSSIGSVSGGSGGNGGSSGNPGSAGGTGASGGAGASGQVNTAIVHVVNNVDSNGFYVHAQTSNGNRGGHGSGGGGGGAGGGQTCFLCNDGGGNGGGGGGGGGEAAVAGTAGQSGGASIGLVVLSTGSVVASNNIISTNIAGNGGAGSTGNFGGSGGARAFGAAHCTGEVGRGGNGGDGGSGGPSSGGQAGAGGPTIALWISGNAASYDLSNNTLSTAQAGNGGSVPTTVNGVPYTFSYLYAGAADGGFTRGISSAIQPATITMSGNIVTLGGAGSGGSGQFPGVSGTSTDSNISQ